MKFRALGAAEIDVRIGSSNEKGISLLLYKDARCDMRMLDETVGAANWQRRHYECKGNLFCSVGIKQGEEWIWKDDCGTESNAEKEKGEASDSFKRACFNWGIGRELYTTPFIWINAASGSYTAKEIKGKMSTCDRFEVEHIKVEEGEITELKIRNATLKKAVYSYPDARRVAPQQAVEKYICAWCGKELEQSFYQKSLHKYGAGYCSGECLAASKGEFKSV